MALPPTPSSVVFPPANSMIRMYVVPYIPSAAPLPLEERTTTIALGVLQNTPDVSTVLPRNIDPLPPHSTYALPPMPPSAPLPLQFPFSQFSPAYALPPMPPSTPLPPQFSPTHPLPPMPPRAPLPLQNSPSSMYPANAEPPVLPSNPQFVVSTAGASLPNKPQAPVLKPFQPKLPPNTTDNSAPAQPPPSTHKRKFEDEDPVDESHKAFLENHIFDDVLLALRKAFTRKYGAEHLQSLENQVVSKVFRDFKTKRNAIHKHINTLTTQTYATEEQKQAAKTRLVSLRSECRSLCLQSNTRLHAEYSIELKNAISKAYLGK